MEFIEKELQPYILENYRVNDTRYLIGQSLGGLLASEILLKKPHLFSHYFIISPSLWWDNESLLNAAPKLLAGQPDTERYVYVSVGKDEDKIMRREAESLFQILQKSAKKNLKSEFNLMQGENHATVLHRSIYEGFLRLFPYKN
ncbi:MAG: alpha/beta hydrolase [Cytophagaceae bacterium]|nr:alpha/beta hydrolase [Cytophagaceae bacterium]